MIQTTSYARKHTEGGTGELTTSSARVTYTASWFDGANRQTATANYGTNGGSAFSRPSSRSGAQRHGAGHLHRVRLGRPWPTRRSIRPGKESRSEFDDAGRITKQIDNYEDGNPVTGAQRRGRDGRNGLQRRRPGHDAHGQEPDHGRPGHEVRLRHDVGGITPEIDRNDLLRAEIYPDSDDTTSLGNGADGTYDRVEYKYNSRGIGWTGRTRTARPHLRVRQAGPRDARPGDDAGHRRGRHRAAREHDL